jgi:Regulator of chromosome condensation (RCC1) repeat
VRSQSRYLLASLRLLDLEAEPPHQKEVTHEDQIQLCLFASMISMATLGCGSEGEGGQVTSAQLAITTVPTGVLCVKVVVMIGTQLINPPLMTVAAGASSASLSLGQLPTGCSATFQGAAYNVACSSVTSSTVANWLSDQVTAILSVGNVAVVPMNFRSNSPVTVKANFEASVAEVYTSVYASYARMSDGTVMQWGATGAANNVTPIAVPSLTNVVSIAGGQSFACAAKTDGTVWCWGYNWPGGNLGPNVAAGSSTQTPVQIPGLSGVSKVSAGTAHVCAVTATGYLYCWGDNTAGQFGNGTTGASNPTPVLVSTATGSVSAGSNFTCTLDSYGNVLCAGGNDEGQLGNGTTLFSANFVHTWTGGAIAIAAGLKHACFIALDSTVRCFGFNGTGQLGDGTTTMQTSPVVVAGLNNVVQIGAGASHTCALLQNGTVNCWGQNLYLGTGQTSNQLAPVQVPGLSGVVALHANQGAHTCVDLSDNSVKCWGNNSNGQIGNGSCDYAAKPTTVLF